MEVSKAWNWALEKSDVWKVPSEESYALAARWKEKKYRELLDFGCGLGRHTVLFARQGFHVTAFDLSETGAAHTAEWAAQENL